MSDVCTKEYEILSKLVKKDHTSLVSLVCCVDGVCCIVPKDDIPNHTYTNATIGVNGKLYRRKSNSIGRSITFDRVAESDVVGVSRGDVIQLLNRLRLS